nr:hypothetical protein [Kofleriaceae bacterium]
MAAGAHSASADPLKPATTALGWDVNLDALLQVDAVPYAQGSVDDLNPGNGEPLNEETILVRRALLRAQAHRDKAFASIELESNDLNGPVTRLLGAYVGWSEPATHAGAPPIVTVVGGLFLIPFGAEVPTNLRDKPFLEVPTWANALFPGNYDGGVMARGAYGVARWTVAVTDGAPSGDLQWKGRDPQSSYDLIARLGGVIDARETAGRPRVDFGISVLTGKGFHPGIQPTKDSIVWVDANGNGMVDPTEIIDVPGSPGEPSVSFSHDAIGGDASVRWCLQGAGGGWAFAEGVIAKNLDRGLVYADPIAGGRDVRELGYSAGVVQDATEWGQFGARYDRYDADRDAATQGGLMFVQTKQIFSTLSVYGALRWTTTRLQLQYDHNRNPFGLADNGLPTTRGDDRLTIRAQVKW